MNFSNILYAILWVFVYYVAILIVPFGINLLTSISIFSGLWALIPAETHWLIGIFLYIVVPLVGVAFIIRSGSPQSQIVVQ